MGEWGCGIRDSERRRRDGSRLSPIPNPQPPMPDLKGNTLFITGASRGIGLAIALRAARDGANVAIAPKSDVHNPKLSRNIHPPAEAVNAPGGRGRWEEHTSEPQSLMRISYALFCLTK